MSYEVIKAFTDKNPNSAESAGGAKHIYWIGDNYPYRKYVGATTQDRLSELTSGSFIKEASDDGK